MRITGFRLALEEDEVAIWELVEVPLDLEMVIAHRIVSADPSRPRRVVRMRSSFSDELGPHTLARRAAPIAVRRNDGTLLECKGLIVGLRAGALVHFLARRYEPRTNGEVESLIRRASAEGASADALSLRLADLFTEPNPHRMRFASSLTSPVVLAPNREEFLSNATRVERPEGAFVFASAIPERSLTVAHEFTTEVGAAHILRRAWAMIGYEGDPVLHWDGVAFHIADSLADLPEEFLERIETEGTAHAEPTAAGLPVPEMRVRFAAVVGARDWKAARAQTPAAGIVERPAFVLDSRCEICIEAPESLPVLTDVGELMWLLQRCARGAFFVPTRRPGMRIPDAEMLPPCLLGAVPM